MKLQVQFKAPVFADMDIAIRAKGFIAAAVYWANESGLLPGRSSIAMIAIEPSGNAKYRFEGHRAIPAEATHVYAKCISSDFSSMEEAIVEIPQPCRIALGNENLIGAFSVMSDLHLSGKPGRISRALSMAKYPVLIPGDLTTHFSPNTKQGNVKYSCDTETIYIDDGSVAPTELSGEALMPSDWKDGVITELMIYDSSVEIQFRSIHTGDLYPRGYYRFVIGK